MSKRGGEEKCLTLSQASLLSGIIRVRPQADTKPADLARWRRAQESGRRRDNARALANSKRYNASVGKARPGPGKKWQAWEIQLAHDMVAQGNTYRQVGFCLDRTVQSVRKLFRRLRIWDGVATA